jgi:hypothetical protein
MIGVLALGNPTVVSAKPLPDQLDRAPAHLAPSTEIDRPSEKLRTAMPIQDPSDCLQPNGIHPRSCKRSPRPEVTPVCEPAVLQVPGPRTLLRWVRQGPEISPDVSDCHSMQQG